MAMSKEEKKERRRQRRLKKQQEQEAEAQSYAGGKASSEKEKPEKPLKKNEILKSSERNKFEKMIEKRGELLRQSLLTEMSMDTASIRDKVKKRLGVTRTKTQIKGEIKSIQEEIEELNREEVSNKDSVMSTQLGELEDEEIQAVSEMEQRHKAEKEDLKEKFRQKRNEIQDQRNRLREEIAVCNSPDLLRKIDELKRESEKVSKTSNQVEMEVRTEKAIRNKQKDKILGIVNDTIARATEQVWSTEARSEAVKILNSIPTVSELVMMFRDGTQDAMRNLFERLMKIQSNSVGQLQLAAPEELFSEQFDNASVVKEVRENMEEEGMFEEDSKGDKDDEDPDEPSSSSYVDSSISELSRNSSWNVNARLVRD